MKDFALPEKRVLPDRHLSLRKEHLVAEITRDRRVLLKRRPFLMRAGIAVGIVVVVLAVLSIMDVFGGHGTGIVEKASAALARSEDAILHVKVSSTVTEIGSATFTSTKETWAYASTSNVRREIVTEPETGASMETAVVQSGLQQIYDPSTDTIHQLGHTPPAAMGLGPLEQFLDEIRSRPDSGALREDGTETIDSREAVRLVETATAITDAAGRTYGRVYLVDAETGAPLEVRDTRDTEDEILRFAVYEELPATREPRPCESGRTTPRRSSRH
jgi:hypothetical protein